MCHARGHIWLALNWIKCNSISIQMLSQHKWYTQLIFNIEDESERKKEKNNPFRPILMEMFIVIIELICFFFAAFGFWLRRKRTHFASTVGFIFPTLSFATDHWKDAHGRLTMAPNNLFIFVHSIIFHVSFKTSDRRNEQQNINFPAKCKD